MLKKFSLMLAVALAFGFVWATAANAGFDDVPADHWAYDAVEYLADEGLVIGYPDGTYGGNRLLTRYEFAMVIVRLYNDIMDRVDIGDPPDVDVEAVLDMLMDEFQPEIDELRDLIADNADRIDELEGTVDGFDGRIDEIAKLVDGMDARFHPFGDLALRIFGTYPETGLDANHPQFQLRWGFTSQVTDELSFGARFVSGDGSNPRQNDYVTIGDAFGYDGIHIDRAYMMWKPEAWNNLTFWGGKFAPTWITTPIVYDSDVQTEGLAQRYTWKNFTFNLAELVPSHQGLYIVAQAVVSDVLLDDSRFALTYHYITPSAWGNSIYPDMVGGILPSRWIFSRLDSPEDDYRAIEAYWDWTSQVGNIPFRIKLNYLRNLEDTAPGLPDEAGLQQAAWAYLGFNDFALADCGDWNIWFEFGRTQPNSVLTWQSCAWRRGNDTQFILAGFNYKLFRNTTFMFAFINRETLVGSAPDSSSVLAIVTTKF